MDVLPYLEWFRSLIEVIAWPLTALIALFVFRLPVAQLIGRASKIRISKEGVEIITPEVAEERVESLAKQLDTVQRAGEAILRPEAKQPQIMALQ